MVAEALFLFSPPVMYTSTCLGYSALLSESSSICRFSKVAFPVLGVGFLIWFSELLWFFWDRSSKLYWYFSCCIAATQMTVNKVALFNLQAAELLLYVIEIQRDVYRINQMMARSRLRWSNSRHVGPRWWSICMFFIQYNQIKFR